jgi:hypothetical protein
VRQLLVELRDDLEDHREWETVEALALRLTARGTSAHHQRALMHEGVSQQQIAQRLAGATLAAATEAGPCGSRSAPASLA